MVKRKRVYLPPKSSDGYRVLVDRLWPRGLSKDEVRLDAWHKELGPSDELRTWFGHDPGRWTTFASRFRRELGRGSCPELLDELARRARRGTVTLLFGARDEDHNNAVVIEQAIQARMARGSVRTTRRPVKAEARRGTRRPVRAEARRGTRRPERNQLPSVRRRRAAA